ncbi:MAG: endolytic transglycosylase MltG [Eubacteriales bacterium]|nr:endolytic transglycosylase MltG [Eubacteriales bacterium]
MADRKRRARRRGASRQAVQTERYNIKTLHEDREYGLYWYAWIWKILRPVLIFLCSLLIVIGMVSVVYNKVYDNFLGPVDANHTEKVKFEIESGQSVTSIGASLEKQNLIHSGSIFKYMVQFEGLSNKLSYGSFELSPSMTVQEIVSELTSGSQTSERTITIVPGWTCEDVAEYLLEEGAIDSTEEFLNLCNDVDRFVGDSYALKSAQDAGTLAGRKYALEGYLAPDTYRVFMSASAESIIATLLEQHNKVIDSVYYADNVQYRIEEDGSYTAVEGYESDLTMDQYIILASMIEKEAAKSEDYARVSAVFHNRLKQGWRLESDPTATYTFGLSHYILSQEELTDQNLYNTYVVSGLPIGPICNPSTAALQAAMHPDMEYIEQGYMYFCATDPGTGELAFAITREEHEQNVARYQQMWAEYDARNTVG